MKKRKMLFFIILFSVFFLVVVIKINPIIRIVINNSFYKAIDNEIPGSYMEEIIISDNSPNIDTTTIKEYTYKKIDEKDLLNKKFIKVSDNKQDVKDKIYIIKQMLKFYDIEYDKEDYYKVLQDITLEDYYTIKQFPDRYIHYSYTIYYFDMDKMILYYIHTDN